LAGISVEIFPFLASSLLWFNGFSIEIIFIGKLQQTEEFWLFFTDFQVFGLIFTVLA
jgi:hypothetical protein